MSTIFARSGPLDARRAVRTIRIPVLGKRRGWVCAECTARTVLKQRRSYGDDSSARLTDDGSVLFPGEVEQGASERNGEQTWRRGDWARRAWGLGVPASKELGSQRSRSERVPGAFSEGGFSRSYQDAPEVTASHVRAEDENQNALWEQFERAGEAFESIEGISDNNDAAQDAFSPVASDKLLDLDYKTELPGALLRDEADLVARCLFAADQANDLDFLRSIPSTTYSEIIRTLEPSKFVTKLASAHLEVSAAMVAQLGMVSMHRVALEYTSLLRQVLAIRRSAGVKATLADYTILLRSARDLGNKRMGAAIWKALLSDGHVPNTTCYNYYMSTVIWNGIHSAGSRRNIRVIPFNMLQRNNARNSRWRGYRVGERGVREQAMSIFNEMLAKGAIADEESFRVLITASAREGDLVTVKSVLKRVWGVDVDAIMKGVDESTIAPRDIPKHSPMMPTSRLLFTVAHAFGINNDIPCALRVVDFIARHFELEITDDVWEQLFEWTFVLSVERSGTAKRNGYATGQLPKESVLGLWNTMTRPPYSIKPTIGMYNYLIKNLFYRGNSAEIAIKMAEGRALFQKHAREARQAFAMLRKEIRRSNEGLQHRSIEKCRNAWEHAELIRRRDMFWMERWTRLYLGSFSTHFTGDALRQRYANELPPLLWQWRGFLRTHIRYETPTGLVEFDSRTEEEMIASQQWRLRNRGLKKGTLDRARKIIGNDWLNKKGIVIPRRLQEHVAR